MKSSELTTYLDMFEKAAGTSWLHDQVERIRDRDPGHVPGALPGSTGIHPLASSWFKAREELILSELTGRHSFSESTLRIARLGEDLSVVNDLLNARQKEKLLDYSQYPKASYEITVAAGYVRSGALVEFAASGFKIIHPGGSIMVECRSLGDEPVGDAINSMVEREIKSGESGHGATLLYLELASRWCVQLCNFTKQNGKSAALLSGNLYNALVITCRETITGAGGQSLRETGVMIPNPSPPFYLPAGFTIYIPGESSS
ncbi:MAG: hypothetical protein K6U74_14170 [Firmicutes bacterium]|nr:hypothetical protein [Bacillota bacterium]